MARKTPASVGIIPARGGSKSIPRKNLRLLDGKPLIVHTIEAAKASKRLERVVVSTDDAEIASVAREYGAEVPVMRPRELGGDDSPTIAAVQHMVRELGGEAMVDVAVTLQPTSPLREGWDIDEALRILADTGADSVISVSPVKQNPWLMFRVEDGKLAPFFDEAKRIRRQDLTEVYALNGAIYATKAGVLLDGNSLYGRDPRAYVMPEERSIDIDSLFDFDVVSFLMKRRRGEI